MSSEGQSAEDHEKELASLSAINKKVFIMSTQSLESEITSQIESLGDIFAEEKAEEKPAKKEEKKAPKEEPKKEEPEEVEELIEEEEIVQNDKPKKTRQEQEEVLDDEEEEEEEEEFDPYLEIPEMYRGEIIGIEDGHAMTRLVPEKELFVDEYNMVYSPLIDCAAQFCALLAVNEDNCRIAKTNAESLAPIKNAMPVIIEATVQYREMKKIVTKVTGKCNDLVIYASTVILSRKD